LSRGLRIKGHRWRVEEDKVGVFVTFHCCDKMFEQNNLKWKKLIWGHGSRGFSPWSLGSIVSGLWLGQDIMAENKGAHFMVAWRQRERERERELKGLGMRYNLQRWPTSPN
jgi:hypothetical protein